MPESSSLCSVCGKSRSEFKTNKDFREHSCIKNCVSCEKCLGKILKIHLETVHQQRNFQCGNCDKVLKSASALNRHAKSHISERSFHCDFCNKYFQRNHQLKRHILSCTREKKSNNNTIIKCNECSKTFSRGNL